MQYPILLILLTLTSCSVITDYLLKQDTGVAVDLQAGSNENKVKTGVGSLGLDKKTNLTVEDSSNIAISNTDDKYHITTEGDTEINVYETNRWIYAIFGLYLIGKPTLRWWWQRRTKLHPHEYVTYITASPNTGNSRDIHYKGYCSASNTNRKSVFVQFIHSLYDKIKRYTTRK